jgi:hypothetical protein
MIDLDQVLLADSYVLGFYRQDADVVVVMELTLAFSGLGRMFRGKIVFSAVEEEAWYTITGSPSTLENIGYAAHRYRGPEELADLGTIISISSTERGWHVKGDWGECRLQSRSKPRLIVEEEL